MNRLMLPVIAAGLLAGCAGEETAEDIEIDTTAPSDPFDDEVPDNTVLQDEAVPNPEAEPGEALEPDDES